MVVVAGGQIKQSPRQDMVTLCLCLTLIAHVINVMVAALYCFSVLLEEASALS